jgi:hypothetical protein
MIQRDRKWKIMINNEFYIVRTTRRCSRVQQNANHPIFTPMAGWLTRERPSGPHLWSTWFRPRKKPTRGIHEACKARHAHLE